MLDVFHCATSSVDYMPFQAVFISKTGRAIRAGPGRAPYQCPSYVLPRVFGDLQTLGMSIDRQRTYTHALSSWGHGSASSLGVTVHVIAVLLQQIRPCCSIITGGAG